MTDYRDHFYIHAVPLRDLRAHVEDGIFCPRMPLVVDGVVRHNSYDRREVGEVVRKALELLSIVLAGIDHEWSDDELRAYDHAVYLLDLHWPKKPTEPKP